jgi:pyruvate ferredoxin oxidoreductase gamma subunit
VYEVRFHGRGGQGAVMAAQALADAAFVEGNYAVAFPWFGAERRGAPVLAFTRVDEKKINIKTRVYTPDYVVVLDDKLIDFVNVAEGLNPDGIAILNSPLDPEDVDLGLSVKTATVDATSVALEVLGVPITNSAILGAFAWATKLVSLDGVKQGIMDIFGPRIGEEVAKKNAEAAAAAHDRVKIGKCKGERKYPEVKKWLPAVQDMPLSLATKPTKTNAGLVGPGSSVENKTGSWRTFTPKFDEEACNNCLLCWFYCPDSAVERLESPRKVGFIMDYCKGCGICAEVCPKDAIEMVR